ncbi:MAG: hypothetical protein MZV64_43925 [Ignavibacteriales bacterium]|nr:hypothetical protein [Ignavibacteriales bacterium]
MPADGTRPRRSLGRAARRAPGRRRPHRLQGPDPPLLARATSTAPSGRSGGPCELQPRSRRRPGRPGRPGLLAGRRRRGPRPLPAGARPRSPNHAGALFRVGSVLLWQGDYGRARGYLGPGRRARAAEQRTSAAPSTAPCPSSPGGPRSGSPDGTSTGATAGPTTRDLGLSALFGLFADRARFVAKAGRSWRAGGHDDQLGLEAYPQLWKGAYGYLDLSLAPKAEFVPHVVRPRSRSTSPSSTRYEVSLGVRQDRRRRRGRSSSWSASAAGLSGAPGIRTSASIGPTPAAGPEFTWMAGLRRYFAEDELRLGERRPRCPVVRDRVRRRDPGRAGLVRRGRLRRLSFSGTSSSAAMSSRRTGIGGADSTALALVAGYRF